MPRVSGVVDKTITRSARAGIIMDEFLIGHGEQWVIVKQLVHSDLDIVLEAQCEFTYVINMQRARVDDGDAACGIRRIEGDEGFVGRTKRGEATLEQVKSGHHGLVFFEKIFFEFDKLIARRVSERQDDQTRVTQE